MGITKPVELKHGECYCVMGRAVAAPHYPVVIHRTTEWATAQEKRRLAPVRWVEIGFSEPHKVLNDILGGATTA